MIDWAKGLRTLNLPKVDTELIPDPPLSQGGYPTAGRPPRIAPERDRPNAPSRPGFSRTIALAPGEPSAEEWLEAGIGGLTKIDEIIRKTEKLVLAERLSVEAEIRNLATKTLARARTEGGDIDARNRTLAAELGRDVEALLEQSMFQDLLDEREIVLARTRSPLATQHVAAFQAAAQTLSGMGFSTPGRSAGTRIVRDVVRDAKSNGRGIVHRETRRVMETFDRAVMDEVPLDVAEKIADRYRLPERDFLASTVHHVRATARKTLAFAEDEAAAWLVAAGDPATAEVLARAPSGQVADLLFTVHTRDELDRLYRGIVVEEGRPMTSWKGLGLNFGSEEGYLPIPPGLLAAVTTLALERRRAWVRRRREAQEALDAAR
jgi:hypothetical protein